jgi:hypothetical protein
MPLAENAASAASPASTLITCTDLNSQKTVVLRANQNLCKPFHALAVWRIQQSDSSAHTGAGYANLRTCTSKRAEFNYILIKSKCAKYQVTNDYWRSAALPAKPVITQASSYSHESAFLALASESATNTDAPIAYYTITSSKGDVKKVYYWRDLNVIVSGLSSSTSYTFTISATSVDGTSPVSASSLPVTTRVYVAPVAVATSAPVDSCANGGVCIVGDRGPGGGIVYYVSATPFTSTGSTCNTTCKYLEVAPAGWNNGAVVANDPSSLVWSNNTTTATGQDTVTAGTERNIAWEKFNWKIGQGFFNTSVMKVAGAASTAQAAVLAYAGGGFTGQWFIPSINELNELCKYARGQTTGDLTVACTSGGTLKTTASAGTDLGGFVANAYYWSSSEYSASHAGRQYFDSSTQNFVTKTTTGDYVRPVRAF